MPDGVATARPSPDLGLKYLARAIERIAGEQHARDVLTVPSPLFNLVEIAVVGDQRLGPRAAQLGEIVTSLLQA